MEIKEKRERLSWWRVQEFSGCSLHFERKAICHDGKSTRWVRINALYDASSISRKQVQKFLNFAIEDYNRMFEFAKEFGASVDVLELRRGYLPESSGGDDEHTYHPEPYESYLANLTRIHNTDWWDDDGGFSSWYYSG
jgi:hypothetical protein